MRGLGAATIVVLLTSIFSSSLGCVQVRASCKADVDCCAPYQCSTIGGGRECAAKCGMEMQICGTDTERPCCSGFSCVGNACVTEESPTNCLDLPCKQDADCCAPFDCSTIGGARVCATKCGTDSDKCGADTERECCDGFTCEADVCVTGGSVAMSCAPENTTCSAGIPCCSGLVCSGGRCGSNPATPRDPSGTCSYQFEVCSSDADCCAGYTCGNNGIVDMCEK